MLTDFQQSLQTKYPHVTFNHEEYSAILPEAKHTDALQEELFSVGYFLSIGGEEGHFTYRWLTQNVGNTDFPMLLKFSSFRKDKRESLLKVLAFVFFFSCYCGDKHKCKIWMAQEYLSKKTGMDKRTIGRTIKTLQELGIITCIRHGNNIVGKASTYSVSPEVFITAFLSADLCNLALRWWAREYRGAVSISPDATIHCYGKIDNVLIQALFPSEDTHGCRVEWHDECYRRTFSSSLDSEVVPEALAMDKEHNENSNMVKMSSYPSSPSLGGHFETQAVSADTSTSVCTTGYMLKCMPNRGETSLKDAFHCVSVYEHSLDFSNIVIGPQMRFPAPPFESSA